MRAILINDLRRLWTQKQLIILLVIFTTVAAVAAIFLSTGLKQTWDVAVVSNQAVDMVSENINFYPMEKSPSRAELVSGRYDAILHMNSDGSYTADTIKSEEAEKELLSAIAGTLDTVSAYSSRGTGTNVLGFLMMFLLLMGSMAMSMYADDKDHEQINRIAASPVGMGKYLFAHSLFDFCFLFFPTMVILSLIRWISGVSFGYNFLELAVLIAIICAFSTAFCLLLYSLLSNKAESAKMTGNTIIILTSILAGGFYAFDKGNRALEFITAILPQKAYLVLAEGMEQGAKLITYLPALVYLLVLIVAFYIISVVKTKRAYVNKR